MALRVSSTIHAVRRRGWTTSRHPASSSPAPTASLVCWTSILSPPIGSIAAYYDLPTVSLRDALFPLNVHHPTSGFLWHETYNQHHPGDAGHQALADLVVNLIQETALGLLTHPPSSQELEELKWPLPPPMYQGACLRGGCETLDICGEMAAVFMSCYEVKDNITYLVLIRCSIRLPDQVQVLDYLTG